jgi:hypothetical protein
MSDEIQSRQQGFTSKANGMDEDGFSNGLIRVYLCPSVVQEIYFGSSTFLEGRRKLSAKRARLTLKTSKNLYFCPALRFARNAFLFRPSPQRESGNVGKLRKRKDKE